LCIKVNSTTQEAFSDGNLVPEQALLDGDVYIGVRNIPSLNFESLMAPFRVLEEFAVSEFTSDGDIGEIQDGDESDGADSGGESEAGNRVNVNNHDTAETETKWWRSVKVFDDNYARLVLSERQSLFHIVRNLATDRSTSSAHTLVPAFFRHFWRSLMPPDNNDEDDLGFARIKITVESDYPAVTPFDWFWPSKKAWAVAEFQHNSEDSAALARIFPRFCGQFMAGIDVGVWGGFISEASESAMCFLSTLMNLTSGNRDAAWLVGGPWSWPPQLPQLADDDVDHMPLVRAHMSRKLPRAPLAKVIVSLFNQCLDNINGDAVGPAVNLYKCLQYSVVFEYPSDSSGWVEALKSKIKSWEDQLHGAESRNDDVADEKARLDLLTSIQKVAFRLRSSSTNANGRKEGAANDDAKTIGIAAVPAAGNVASGSEPTAENSGKSAEITTSSSNTLAASIQSPAALTHGHATLSIHNGDAPHDCSRSGETPREFYRVSRIGGDSIYLPRMSLLQQNVLDVQHVAEKRSTEDEKASREVRNLEEQVRRLEEQLQAKRAILQKAMEKSANACKSAERGWLDVASAVDAAAVGGSGKGGNNGELVKDDMNEKGAGGGETEIHDSVNSDRLTGKRRRSPTDNANEDPDISSDAPPAKEAKWDEDHNGALNDALNDSSLGEDENLDATRNVGDNLDKSNVTVGSSSSDDHTSQPGPLFLAVSAIRSEVRKALIVPAEAIVVLSSKKTGQILADGDVVPEAGLIDEDYVACNLKTTKLNNTKNNLQFY
jgi:hypothetical protein